MKGLWMQATPNVVVAAFLIILVNAVIVYDWIALAFYGEEYTISVVVRDWGQKYQIVPISVGILVCHLFLLFGGHGNIERNKMLRHNGDPSLTEQFASERSGAALERDKLALQSSQSGNIDTGQATNPFRKPLEPLK